MKRFSCLLIAGLALSGLAGAAQLCTGPTNVSGLSCSVGRLPFSNFRIIAAARNAAPEVDLVSANVARNGPVTRTFNPNECCIRVEEPGPVSLTTNRGHGATRQRSA